MEVIQGEDFLPIIIKCKCGCKFGAHSQIVQILKWDNIIYCPNCLNIEDWKDVVWGVC